LKAQGFFYMLSREEVHERARYCYLVFHQLSCLASHESVPASEHYRMLKQSSLKLAEDDFMRMTFEEEAAWGQTDHTLSHIINLYEGFTHAFCEVLQMSFEELRGSISPGYLTILAEEMRPQNPGRDEAGIVRNDR